MRFAKGLKTREKLAASLAAVAVAVAVVGFLGNDDAFSPKPPVEKTRESSISPDKSRDKSWDQRERNFRGEASDPFTCNISTAGRPIVSFDGGHYWWTDDGRCARIIHEQEHEQEQKNRDADAEVYSYWPTTVRVETDADSSWLVNEERTCQTHPDKKGRVALVVCNPGLNQLHNIPIKFWGGVDRNKVSDWKCRREGDGFACRASD